MAALSIQSIVPAGIGVSFSAAAVGGDTIATAPDQLTWLHVKNGGGSSINVTIAAAITSVPNALAGTQTVANSVVAVPAGAEREIGPFPQAFIDGNGNVAAKRLPRVA